MEITEYFRYTVQPRLSSVRKQIMFILKSKMTYHDTK